MIAGQHPRPLDGNRGQLPWKGLAQQYRRQCLRAQSMVYRSYEQTYWEGVQAVMVAGAI